MKKVKEGAEMSGNKKTLKGSFTVEGAIIIPLFIFIIAAGMNIALLLYQDIKNENECENVTNMWLVDDFYNYQILKEVADELQ